MTTAPQGRSAAALHAALAASQDPTLVESALPPGLVEDAQTGAASLYPWVQTASGRDCLTNALAGVLAAGWTVHPAGESCAPPPEIALDLVPHARHRDAEPSTSVAAADRAMPTARSLAYRLLAIFRGQELRAELAGVEPGGFTVDELDERLAEAGVTTSGAWRRVSDLLALSLIEPVPGPAGDPLTRPGRSGRDQRVHRLTAAGRDLVSTAAA